MKGGLAYWTAWVEFLKKANQRTLKPFKMSQKSVGGTSNLPDAGKDGDAGDGGVRRRGGEKKEL